MKNEWAYYDYIFLSLYKYIIPFRLPRQPQNLAWWPSGGCWSTDPVDWSRKWTGTLISANTDWPKFYPTKTTLVQTTVIAVLVNWHISTLYFGKDNAWAQSSSKWVYLLGLQSLVWKWHGSQILPLRARKYCIVLAGIVAMVTVLPLPWKHSLQFFSSAVLKSHASRHISALIEGPP